jgi:hypothetical protein
MSEQFIVPCPRCKRDLTVAFDSDGFYQGHWETRGEEHPHGELTEPEVDSAVLQAQFDQHNMEHEITGVCSMPHIPHEDELLADYTPL